ncbi:MAG: trypsin-like serine protease [Nostoc sp.]|uniref:trypsin-like serine peptidase n=1 Tax=Nostoc sp. TaxID=1180 RepID=UPI002FF5C25B
MKNQSFAVTVFSTFVLATSSLATGSLAVAQTGSTSGSTSPVASNSNTTVFTAPASSSQTQSIDYSNPRTLYPQVSSFAGRNQAGQIFPVGNPGYKPGSKASSSLSDNSVKLINPITLPPSNTVESDNFGTSNHPFTTARNPQTTGYPYSPSGKLFFNIGNSSYVCSASAIQRGVIVTAAHCVANFGAKQFYSNWQFVPAYNNGNAPYGVWTANKAIVLTSYYNGTDRCSQKGVVCDDDVAVLVMTPKSGFNIGDYTGWYGFGYGGFGFTSFLNNTSAQLTQIGYPVSLDNGVIQERNESLAYTNSNGSYQQLIGSLMTGGSSGGPWLLNYGVNPNVYSPNTLGRNYTANPVVTGVTSWGYNDYSIKEQGASIFTSNNILTLYNTACTYTSLLACK